MSYSDFSSGRSSHASVRKQLQIGNDDLRCELHVSRIPLTCTEADLRRVFNKYDLKTVRVLAKDHRAYAFITVSSPEESSRIIREMSSTMINGTNLYINYAKKQQHFSKQHDFRRLSNDNNCQQSPDDEHCTRSPNDDHGRRSPNDDDVTPLQNGDVDYDDMPPLEPIEPYYEDYNDSLPTDPPTTSSLSCSNDENDYNTFEEDSIIKVMISNYPQGASDFEIMDIFRDYKPRQCLVLLAKPDLRLGEDTCAFVYFGDMRQAALATENLHRTEYQGKTIKVWNLR